MSDCPAHAEVALDLGCSIDGSDATIAELAGPLVPGEAFTELEAVRALDRIAERAERAGTWRWPLPPRR